MLLTNILVCFKLISYHTTSAHPMIADTMKPQWEHLLSDESLPKLNPIQKDMLSDMNKEYSMKPPGQPKAAKKYNKFMKSLNPNIPDKIDYDSVLFAIKDEFLNKATGKSLFRRFKEKVGVEEDDLLDIIEYHLLEDKINKKVESKKEFNLDNLRSTPKNPYYMEPKWKHGLSEESLKKLNPFQKEIILEISKTYNTKGNQSLPNPIKEYYRFLKTLDGSEEKLKLRQEYWSLVSKITSKNPNKTENKELFDQLAKRVQEDELLRIFEYQILIDKIDKQIEVTREINLDYLKSKKSPIDRESKDQPQMDYSEKSSGDFVIQEDSGLKNSKLPMLQGKKIHQLPAVDMQKLKESLQ